MATSPSRTNTITTTPRYNGKCQRDTKYSTPIFSLSSSPNSHSSNSSFGSLSNFQDHSPRTPLQFSKGVPFSWEHIPGIPKQQSTNISRKNDSNNSLSQLLPLPPPAGNNNNHSIKNNKQRLLRDDHFSPRKNASESFRKDPFFAAFVECSKDHNQEQRDKFGDHDYIWKTSSTASTRSLSDRFGFISMYGSCKRTCSVSESIVYLPRSRNHYDLLTRRTSR